MVQREQPASQTDSPAARNRTEPETRQITFRVPVHPRMTRWDRRAERHCLGAWTHSQRVQDAHVRLYDCGVWDCHYGCLYCQYIVQYIYIYSWLSFKSIQSPLCAEFSCQTCPRTPGLSPGLFPPEFPIHGCPLETANTCLAFWGRKGTMVKTVEINGIQLAGAVQAPCNCVRTIPSYLNSIIIINTLSCTATQDNSLS